MPRLARFLRRPRPQQRLLLHALWLLARVRLSLGSSPIALSAAGQSASLRLQYKPGQPAPSVADICQAITIAAKFVPGATCLTQALVGQILLGQAGHPVTLQIGVLRRPAGPLQAHAWLESAGQVILGNVPELSHMQPLRPAAE